MAIILVLLLAGGEIAQPEAQEANFSWEGQGGTAFRRALEDGDDAATRAAELLARGLGTRYPTSTVGALVNKALRSYEQAAALDPASGEPHYRAGLLIYAAYFRGLRSSTADRVMAARALAHWDAFEAKAPLDPRLADALFHRSLVHTVLADEKNFRLGIAIYDRLMRMQGPTPTTNIYNKAELHMMVGELKESIELFRHALAVEGTASHGYGLAVALDRDGQKRQALDVMRLWAFGDQLRTIIDEQVFYVPDGEKHYYLGLGFEALGDYDNALKNFVTFINSGAHPQFQARAREHIKELTNKIRPKRGAVRR